MFLGAHTYNSDLTPLSLYSYHQLHMAQTGKDAQTHQSVWRHWPGVDYTEEKSKHLSTKKQWSAY